jgi:hypothetical protein
MKITKIVESVLQSGFLTDLEERQIHTMLRQEQYTPDDLESLDRLTTALVGGAVVTITTHASSAA